MKSAIFACFAASIISCIGTSLELSPYAIFSLIEQSNKIGSCETIPKYYYYDFKIKFYFKITITFSIMIFFPFSLSSRRRPVRVTDHYCLCPNVT